MGEETNQPGAVLRTPIGNGLDCHPGLSQSRNGAGSNCTSFWGSSRTSSATWEPGRPGRGGLRTIHYSYHEPEIGLAGRTLRNGWIIVDDVDVDSGSRRSNPGWSELGTNGARAKSRSPSVGALDSRGGRVSAHQVTVTESLWRRWSLASALMDSIKSHRRVILHSAAYVGHSGCFIFGPIRPIAPHNPHVPQCHPRWNSSIERLSRRNKEYSRRSGGSSPWADPSIGF
ncbi:hypothetical protein N7510_003337 [Penicillium lagena]|uniref:uncharacterized protein n=1 Tax=Penicillium lagena TaxID=94218 RepID=UPI0025419E0F|nr:uncharacterized protein N7510_003337 [Penicillium lagena]KAJ5619353.1 hypothetical protein N7510_003337 [Penicillium lagena]